MIDFIKKSSFNESAVSLDNSVKIFYSIRMSWSHFPYLNDLEHGGATLSNKTDPQAIAASRINTPADGLPIVRVNLDHGLIHKDTQFDCFTRLQGERCTLDDLAAFFAAAG